jgi:hypothetical protein
MGAGAVTTGAARPLFGTYLFLASLWTGTLLFFALGAGIVLRTSPTRSDGGTVNRALLDALDVASLAAVGALFALAVALGRARPWGPTARGLTLRVLGIAAVAAFVSLYLITPEMVSLRQKAGPAFDLLPAGDPARRAWGRLHALSSLTLVLRLLCGTAVFFLGFWQAGKEAATPPPEVTTPPDSVS